VGVTEVIGAKCFGRSITSIAKNVKVETANKLTTPKLIAYSGKMPTNKIIKSKSPRISMFPDLQR